MTDSSHPFELSQTEESSLRGLLRRLGSPPPPAPSPEEADQFAPWCDQAAFALEKKRLEEVEADARTDADKDYLRFLKKVEGSGLQRRRSLPPTPARLLALGERFPNFAGPLRFLAEQAAYAALRGAAFRPPPVLLCGGAGIGKSSFAQALAELLGSRHDMLNMASQTCGFAISGMDRGWSAARPGLVFEALQHGATLAPVIVLDEIDKANEDARSNPLGALYALLEPRTAQRFRDEYAGIPIDASQVVWLATANDADAIPAPLLSRFRVFEIAAPEPEQLIAIAENMLKEMTSGIAACTQGLPASWREHLSGCSVREMRLKLEQAVGRAALRAVDAGCTALDLKDQDLDAGAAPGARRPIGFC